MDVQILNWPEYVAVRDFYGNRTAERSGVPLINHIREGLTVLRHLNANHQTMRAYCLHPLFQNDAELLTVGCHFTLEGTHDSTLPTVILLVMEYRARANAWLSDKCHKFDGRVYSVGAPDPGPLGAVRMMLIADKVQNFKDFLLHHYDSHPRSLELNSYFYFWFEALGIKDQVQDLIELIE